MIPGVKRTCQTKDNWAQQHHVMDRTWTGTEDQHGERSLTVQPNTSRINDGQKSWYITNQPANQVNSAFYLYGIAKLSIGLTGQG